jgi:hypothetical protein
MRKEWIRSEEEKHIKRIQSERNRTIKQSKRPLQVNWNEEFPFREKFLFRCQYQDKQDVLI